MRTVSKVRCPLDRLEGVVTTPAGEAARRLRVVVEHDRSTEQSIAHAIDILLRRQDSDQIIDVLQHLSRLDPGMRRVLELIYDEIWYRKSEQMSLAIAKQREKLLLALSRATYRMATARRA